MPNEESGSSEQPQGDARDFLTESLGVEVATETDIFAEGMVTSLFALELVTFVEQRFGLTVEVDDLDLDNFRSAANIGEFVRRKRGVDVLGDGPPA